MALLCLGIFFLGDSDVLPGLTALAARIDGAHEVGLASADSGVGILLHHPAEPGIDPLLKVSHRHGLACRLICSLCAAQNSESDHVLSFASANLCEEMSGDDGIAATGDAVSMPVPPPGFGCEAAPPTAPARFDPLSFLVERANAPPLPRPAA